MKKEIWKDIKEFEGLYQVSTFGRVKSLKFSNSKKKNEKILKATPNTSRYLHVVLCKNKKHYSKTIHRLVAQVFILNFKNKPQINHKNGIKTDNRIENLEWATQSENEKHAVENKLKLYGENHGRHKLTQIQIDAIRRKYKFRNKTQMELAKEYKVKQPHISRIVNYKTWSVYENRN